MGSEPPGTRAGAVAALPGACAAWLARPLLRRGGGPLDAGFRVLTVLALVAAGVAHWLWFLDGGGFAFTAYDWPKEHAYLDLLRQALSEGRLPLFWSEPYYHGTQRFLAIPEVVLTPDLLLLPLIGPGGFVVLHLLLLWGAGVAGTLLLAARLRLTPPTVVLIFLLFNFNGHITAHLAVGHFQWTGYFLLPWLAVLLAGAAEPGPPLTRRALALGLLLGALFLNGSFHIAVWCLMFLTLLVAAAPTPERARALLIAAGTAAVLAAGRILPALMTFPTFDFASGYPTLADLLAALTLVRTHAHPQQGGMLWPLGWWEYDLFIGVAGLALLAGGMRALARREPAPGQRAVLVAAAVMLLFSVGDLWGLVTALPLPLIGSQRVSSRFAVMALLAVLVLAVTGLDRWLRERSGRAGLLLLAALPLASDLLMHSHRWRIPALEADLPAVALPALSIATLDDPAYLRALAAGWGLSAVALALVTWLLARGRGARWQMRAAPGG